MSSSSESSPAARREEMLDRFDVVEGRLRHHLALGSPAGYTRPDAKTGEQWDAGQVWSHLAEILPYWYGEIVDVVVAAGSDEPVPFGRIKSNPGRIAAIAERRDLDPTENFALCEAGMAQWRAWLADTATDEDWGRVGRHQSLGDMDLHRMLDEFVVGHLEEHADQLDQLRDEPLEDLGLFQGS